jgi:hypothetical protein
VHRVEGIPYLEVFEGCRKECVRESSLRLKVEDRSGGFEIYKRSLKAGKEAKYLEVCKRRHNFARRRTSSAERSLLD